MANVLKVLGQAVPATVNTDIDVYTVPASTSAIVSTITVANLTSSGTVVAQLRIRVAGAAATNKQFIAKDFVIGASDLVSFTLGITLAATDVVTFQASSLSCSCQVFGQEIT